MNLSDVNLRPDTVKPVHTGAACVTRAAACGLVITAIVGLSACGQRGPLYLPTPPDKQPPVQRLPAKADDGARGSSSDLPANDTKPQTERR